MHNACCPISSRIFSLSFSGLLDFLLLLYKRSEADFRWRYLVIKEMAGAAPLFGVVIEVVVPSAHIKPFDEFFKVVNMWSGLASIFSKRLSNLI